MPVLLQLPFWPKHNVHQFEGVFGALVMFVRESAQCLRCYGIKRGEGCGGEDQDVRGVWEGAQRNMGVHGNGMHNRWGRMHNGWMDWPYLYNTLTSACTCSTPLAAFYGLLQSAAQIFCLLPAPLHSSIRTGGQTLESNQASHVISLHYPRPLAHHQRSR